MEDSSQVIWKISTENTKIIPYFQKFADFINHVYIQYDNFSMIEPIEKGFLWIFRNVQYLIGSIQTFKQLRIDTPDEILNQFFQEFAESLIADYDLDRNEEILFKLELINVSADEVFPIIKEYFDFLSAGIHIKRIDEPFYLWRFETPVDFAIFFGMVHFLAQKNM